jgi:(2Fe-2S) ferredoxin
MMTQPKLHLFVCQNDRPAEGRPSCGARGAAQVLSALQRELGADPALWGTIAVTPCGCLGPCFEGPIIVVYPDAVWYRGVTEADVGEIVARHVKGGAAVARLRLETEE